MMNNGLFRAKLRETRGVRTVLPADDEHHIHFRRESKRRRLPLIRRRTDGPEDADVVRFRDEPRRYGLELRAGTSRLGYDAELRKRRKVFRFFLRLNDDRMTAICWAMAIIAPGTLLAASEFDFVNYRKSDGIDYAFLRRLQATVTRNALLSLGLDGNQPT